MAHIIESIQQCMTDTPEIKIYITQYGYTLISMLKCMFL